MLTIQNIENLKGMNLGYWKVSDAEASRPTKWLMTEHYCIRVHRGGEAAAILIWRNTNPLLKQYHVEVCYEDFTNKIYEGAFSKQVLQDKGHFLSHIMGHIKAEYYLRKQK